MKETRLGICAIAATVLLLVIGVFARLAENVYLLGSVDSVICPLLFLAAVVCAYFTLKDKTAYTAKGIWAVIALQAGIAIQCLLWTPYYVIAVKEVDPEILLPVALSAIITVVLYVVGQNLGDASDPRTHM